MESIIVCTYHESLLPEKKSSGAICRDVKIAEPITVHPGELIAVATGIKTRLPLGRQAKMYARSGLPIKCGLMLANGVAVFDADYRGEYILQVFNFTSQVVTYETYARLAQIEFLPAYQPEFPRYGTKNVPGLDMLVDSEVYKNFETIYPTERGNNKFNSTGLH